MKNLLFFNKEGFPYNFTYENNIWNGKLLFDENSNDTFKTLGIYMLESIPHKDILGDFNIEATDIIDCSGMTFVGTKYTTYKAITDIIKANDGPYYSKWIYGTGFDKSYPLNSVITFSGVTASIGDFSNDNYFNVIANKPNGIMILTSSLNSSFSSVNFSGGYIKGVNKISFPKYDGVISEISKLNTDSIITVYNSNYNDSVYNFLMSGSTYGTMYTYNTSALTVNQNLKINIELLTERPKVYSGYFHIDDSSTGTTIEFSKGIDTNIAVGQSIIFEDYYSNSLMDNNQYTVTNIINNELVDTKILNFYVSNGQSYFTTSGDSIANVFKNDYILLSGTTTSTINNRQVKIINIDNPYGSLNRYWTEQYVLLETGKTYNITKILQQSQINTIVCTSGDTASTVSTSGVCFLTSNLITINQTVLPATSSKTITEATIDSINSYYNDLLSNNGISIYYYSGSTDLLVLESSYDSNIINRIHFNSTVYTDTTPITYISSGSSDRMYIYLSGNTLTNEKSMKYEKTILARNHHTEFLLNIENDSTGFGFVATINGLEYFVQFNTNTQTTIQNFISNYYTPLYNMGIEIYSGYTGGYTINVDGINSLITIWELKIRVNSLSSYSTLVNNQNDGTVLHSGRLILNYPNQLYSYFGITNGMCVILSGDTAVNNKQYNILSITGNTLQLSYQGWLVSKNNSINELSTKEYIRHPRGNYQLYTYWQPIPQGPNIDQLTDSIFFYDATGEQINRFTGYTYTGVKPLYINNDRVMLNKEFIRPSLTSSTELAIYENAPKYQKTLFEDLYFDLSVNIDEYDPIPTPLTIFLGYNSPTSGVHNGIMKIVKIEDITFSGYTGSGNEFSVSSNGLINYSTINPIFSFSDYGFSEEQLITLRFDDTSLTGQTIFTNHETYTITSVGRKSLQINTSGKTFSSFNTNSKIYKYTIRVEPRDILSVSIYGETEDEDGRFVEHLSLLGSRYESTDSYIFEETDINDAGIDYIILNKKRKELLSTHPEIFNYIGAYKSVINALNFMGYGDLKMYEYYRNIQPNSPLFRKLHKVLIKDSYETVLEDYSNDPWIKKHPDEYKKTNLFNLVYRITDEEGNNVLLYSLEEVQLKLAGLKRWLKTNILPLYANMTDLSGVAEVNTNLYKFYDTSNIAKKTWSTNNSMGICFSITQTLNFAQNYLTNINFHTITGEIPTSGFTAWIKTYTLSGTTFVPTQYFKMFKTDLSSFSFNINRDIDKYIYVETQYFGERGLGATHKLLQDSTTARNYVLINSNFNSIDYRYYTWDDVGYFFFDMSGNIKILNNLPVNNTIHYSNNNSVTMNPMDFT